MHKQLLRFALSLAFGSLFGGTCDAKGCQAIQGIDAVIEPGRILGRQGGVQQDFDQEMSQEGRPQPLFPVETISGHGRQSQRRFGEEGDLSGDSANDECSTAPALGLFG